MNIQSVIGKILMVFGVVLILLILISVVNPSPKPTPQLATTITPTATPTPPPSPTPTPIQWTAQYFSSKDSSVGWQNSSDNFYLKEGIAKFDIDSNGYVWLIDIDEKRVITIVDRDENYGRKIMKEIYIQHSGNYSLDCSEYYRIVILN